MTSAYRPEIVQRAFMGFLSERLTPFWSLTVPKLRLITRNVLSDDLIALQFETNRAFERQTFDSKAGWHGGEHLNLTVIINGIYHQRSYSLVGLPQQPLWWHSGSNSPKNSDDNDNRARSSKRHTLTIAVKPQGLVSNYLTEHAPLGTIFTSDIPSGDFTLAHAELVTSIPPSASHNEQTPLLFIAGGSGITPMLGLISEALAQQHQVTLLYYYHSAHTQAPFQSYWEQLADRHPTFSYYLVNTEAPDTYLAGSRHLSVESLSALDLPLMTTQIFACGSQDLLSGLYRVAGEISTPNERPLSDNIIIERFGTALPNFSQDMIKNETKDLEPHTVYLRSRQRQFSSYSTLLIDAEQAGIRMTYGCRQGICHMCRCNKISGVVKNIQTGKVSSDGAESIQTCISMAMSDIILDM